MTVGIVGSDYAFIRRFCECIRRSAGEAVKLCGPAADADGLWQMCQHSRPEVLACQSGQFPDVCKRDFPVVVSFMLTPMKGLALSEVKCSCGSGKQLPEIIDLCAAISEASGHFTERNKTEPEFRYAAAEAVQRWGVAADSKGYHYIMDALELLYGEECSIYSCGKMYPAIAEANNTTALQVERAMQRAAVSAGQSGLPMETFLQNIVDAIGFVV